MSSITCPNTSCGAVLEGTDLRHCNRCGAFLPAVVEDAADPLLGQPILNGKYRIGSIIGEGGMGKVYLAEQKVGSGTRKVAIKTLQPDLAQDPQIIARFHREAQTVMELEHPNTIKFYDFDEIELNGRKFLVVVMEFIQGESLAHVLARGAIEVPRAERIMAQVCGSLAEAHERGIVHRDLKPDNIYLTQKGARGDFVKVLDFGIAKRGEAVDDKEAKLTRQGMVLGTPPYMSPEQFTGQSLDARSDIYALGVIAYEMLTGVLPFTAATPWEWATKHLTAQPTPVEAQPGGARVPERHRRAVMRALAKNRDERPASVSQFLQEFTGSAEGATDWTASSTSLANQNAAGAYMPNPGTGPVTGPNGGYSNPGGFTPKPAAPSTPPGYASPGMAPSPFAPTAAHATPNPFYPAQGAAPPGYVPAPSSAGFAAVPPVAPPGAAGSNPSFASSPGGFAPVMPTGYAAPAPVKKSKTGLIIGIVVAVLAIGGGVAVSQLTGDDDDGPQAQTQTNPQMQTNPQTQGTNPQMQGTGTVIPSNQGTTTTGGMVPPIPTPPPQTNVPTQGLPTNPPPQTNNANVPPQTNPGAQINAGNNGGNNNGGHSNSGSDGSRGGPSPAVARGLAAIGSDNFAAGAAAVQSALSSGDNAGATRLRGALRSRGNRQINNLILRGNPGDCAAAQSLFRQLRAAGAAPSTDSFGDACRAP